MSKIIVVEGYSGSGKSTFSKIVAEVLGLEYINLDDLAKTCYSEKGVINELKKHFPSFIFQGVNINFKELGKIVFNDSSKLNILENVLYPILEEKIDFIMKHSKAGCVLDGIKVHETKFFKTADYRIFISRDNLKRIESLISRDGIDEDRAKQRDKGANFKEIVYDLTIDNNGDILDLQSKLPFVVSKILDGRYCFYAGSFDPLTNGHLELIKRASRDYDFVFVGIGDNPNKKRNYNKEEMVCVINEVLKKENLNNTLCFGYRGYTGDVGNKLGVEALVRGIRDKKDEIEEKVIEEYNFRNFNLKTKYYVIEGFRDISSSLVRERIKNGLSIKELVPELIEEYVLKSSVR